jgi:hypothetical protein
MGHGFHGYVSHNQRVMQKQHYYHFLLFTDKEKAKTEINFENLSAEVCL